MITFTKSYKTFDGKVFGTLEEAQVYELENLLNKAQGDPRDIGKTLSKFLLDNKDVLIDILTTTPNSKPKARIIHGGTKKRKTIITDADTNSAMNSLMNNC
jgi:hypothetical protein